MRIFPDFLFRAVTDIPVSFFAENGIKGLLLDIDNTLTEDGSMVLAPETASWIERSAAAGVAMALVSNNSEQRVRPFAEKIGLKFLYEAQKPSVKYRGAALELLGTRPESTAFAGDQIFTDVMFANACGFLSVLVEPIGEDRHRFASLKRFCEKFIKLALRFKKSARR